MICAVAQRSNRKESGTAKESNRWKSIEQTFHITYTRTGTHTHTQYQELKSFNFENYFLITIRHVAVPGAEWERTLCVPQSTYNDESETDKYRAADTFSLSLHSSDSTWEGWETHQPHWISTYNFSRRVPTMAKQIELWRGKNLN